LLHKVHFITFPTIAKLCTDFTCSKLERSFVSSAKNTLVRSKKSSSKKIRCTQLSNLHSRAVEEERKLCNRRFRALLTPRRRIFKTLLLLSSRFIGRATSNSQRRLYTAAPFCLVLCRQPNNAPNIHTHQSGSGRHKSRKLLTLDTPRRVKRVPVHKRRFVEQPRESA
jgi:hypothetical protein